jgi:hypothetical protein
VGGRHSDYFPVLEYIAPRGFYIGSSAEGAKWLDQRNESLANAHLWIHDYLDRRQPTASELRECYAYARRFAGLFEKSQQTWAEEWTRRFPESTEATVALTMCAPANHAEALGRIQTPGEDGGYWDLAAARLRCRLGYEDYTARRNYLTTADAAALLDDVERVLRRQPEGSDPDLFRWKGELEYDLGSYDAAASNLLIAAQGYARIQGREGSLLDTGSRLCESLLAAGRTQDAAAAHESILGRFGEHLRSRLVGARIAAAAR